MIIMISSQMHFLLLFSFFMNVAFVQVRGLYACAWVALWLVILTYYV